MGKERVRFSCHHCGHCCTEVICLPTPWDVSRIIRETGANPYAFLEFVTPDDISEVEDDDPTWLEVGQSRFIMALRRGRKGCFFLDKRTRHCAIYEARPILCRLYPFALEEAKDGAFLGFSLHEDVGCPRHRDGSVPVAPLHALYKDDHKHQKEYAKLVRQFNARVYPAKRPEDFLNLFLEMDEAARKRLRREARA